MRENSGYKVRSFAFVIAVALSVVGAIFLVSAGFVERDETCNGSHLESRINPNYATSASLVRLPAIGPARAQAIIAYRKDFEKTNSNRTAFTNYSDLQQVKGIGPKTVEGMDKLLKFE